MQKITDSPVLKRLFDGLSLTSKHNIPVYCQFCGAEKYEFHNPDTDRISLIDCECEKEFKMLKEVLDANREWLEFPSKQDKAVPNYHNHEDRNKHERFVRKAQERYLRMQEKRAEVKYYD